MDTSSNRPSTFFEYLRAFTSDWLTAMSGVPTVPFALLALFLPGKLRLLWVCLAVFCWVFSSYRVWRNEKTSGDNDIAQLKSRLTELQANKAQLIIYKQEACKFIVHVDGSPPTQPRGVYIVLALEIENKGARASNIRKLDLRIGEINREYLNIKPAPRNFVQGARSNHSVLRNDCMALPTAISAHAIVSGALPFYIPDIIPNDLHVLHCQLIVTDSEGISAEHEFEVQRLD